MATWLYFYVPYTVPKPQWRTRCWAWLGVGTRWSRVIPNSRASSLQTGLQPLAFFPPTQKDLLQGTSDTRNGLLSISCASWLTVYVGYLPIALASLLFLPL